MNPRYVKVFFLYLVSTFISNRLTTNKSLCKTLMQGILGYGLFALGLKYLTIKKNNIKRNRILMIVLPLIKLVFYQATSNSVYDSVTRCLFYVHILNFNIYVLKPSISIYFK